MKKICILFLLTCLAHIPLQAQNMTTIFSTFQDNILLPLDSLSRLDLIDTYKSGKVAQITNSLSDTCILQTFSDNYLRLKSGKNTTVEIVLLPMINDSKIICVIQTVCGPVCDSQLEFYTPNWKKLDKDLFITAVPSSWFLKDEIDREDEHFQSFESQLDINLMQFHFDKDNLTLTQTYTTPQYLSSDQRKKCETYIKKEPKIYHWKQLKFE